MNRDRKLEDGQRRGTFRTIALLSGLWLMCIVASVSVRAALTLSTPAIPSSESNLPSSFLSWKQTFTRDEHVSHSSVSDVSVQEPKRNYTIAALPRLDDPHNVTFRVQPRVFLRWSHGPIPCFHPTEGNASLHWTDVRRVQKTPARRGLFFVKLLKTGSSTAAGVHLRIARNVARRQAADFDLCKVRFRHGWAGRKLYGYSQRQRSESFLWSMVREPTDRTLSEWFHFEHSRKGVPLDERRILRYLRYGPHAPHHMIEWLTVTRFVRGTTDPWAAAAAVLPAYDFLGTVERFDESLVALQMILGLPLADVLHVSIKRSGGYDDGGDGRCTPIAPVAAAALPHGVRKFLAGNAWRRLIAPEVALYQAVDASLDMTIAALGRAEFARNLAVLRAAQEVVRSHCRGAKLPCSEDGKLRAENETDCLTGDMGCGFDCLDEVARTLGLE